jgi:hypothetical protein
MRMFFRSLVAGAILLTAGSAVAAAAEPLLGTWSLNLAKSQFSPGTAPKAFKRVFTAQGDAIDMEISGLTPDGTPFSGHAVFRMDDKDYAITGVGNADTMAVKRIDSSHYLTTMKKDGKVVGSVDSAMSADGKIFTQAVKNASGAVTSTMTFDRQ